uniref:Cyanate hydratase n=1 Tax=Volvariella volvacea TaxID=36659 RepID=A0A193DQH3_9AGAR|nr:cyanate lyase [Volvariella volvacea]
MSPSTAAVSSNNIPFSTLPPVCVKFLEAKARKGLTFDQIASVVGKDETWVAAALYGQAKFSTEELRKVSDFLGVSVEEAFSDIGEQWWPNRGNIGPMPPTDPVLYRLYEGVMVYGYPIKALIHEKFGDGIISMIDCKVHVDKKPDPKGDRVVLTFE